MFGGRETWQDRGKLAGIGSDTNKLRTCHARQMLTDEHWSKLKPTLLQQGIYDKADLRITMEGVFYRIRTGCQWCDLPEDFGCWNTVYKRFNAWSATGKLMTVFNTALYRYRHLFENAFARLKPYRVIATRYDKLKRNDESMVTLAFADFYGCPCKRQQTLVHPAHDQLAQGSIAKVCRDFAPAR